MTASKAHRKTDYIYVALIALSFGLDFLFRNSIGAIADAVEAEYRVTSSGVGLLSSSYYIAYTLVQQPWGLYLQIYSCQSALIISALSLACLSLAFPFTPPSLWLGSVVFFFAGATSGCSFTIALIFGGQRFGSNSVSVCGGITMITATIHSFAGSVIQAEMYARFGVWKPLYFGIAALSFVYGVMALLCIYIERRSATRDPKHSALPQMSLSKTSSNPSKRELENLKLTPWQQMRTAMVRTMHMPGNWLLGVIGFCVGVVYFGVMGLWMVPYLMVKWQYSRSLSASIAGSAFISAGVSSVIVGVASKKLKRRKPFLFGGAALFTAFVLFIYVDAEFVPLPLVIVLTVSSGTAFACFCPLIFTICREYTWFYGAAATAIAFVNTIMVTSGFVGQYTIGALLDWHFERRKGALTEEGNRAYSVDDFNFAFVIVPVCLAVALLASCLLKETNGKNIDYELDHEADECQRTTAQNASGTDTLPVQI